MELFIGLIKLVPAFFNLYFSISKFANITSPPGVLLLDVGVPISLLGVTIFILRFIFKKVKA
jgi:hypothetical protein